jgi:hypothetical protein
MIARAALCAALFSACVQDVVLARPRAAEDAAVSVPDAASADPLVTGSIIATFDRPEESELDRVETRFSLQWIEPGAEVGGRSSVESPLGTVELALVDGQYVGAQRGYAEAYTLVMAREGGSARCTLRGPRAHRIDEPSSGARVRPAGALEVRWSPSGAPSATIASNGLPETPVSDSGRFVVPASALPGAFGRATEDRVRVRRAADVPVQGASTASTVRVMLVRSAPFVIEPR